MLIETLRFSAPVQTAFKPLNAVNGGPWHRRGAFDQIRSNLEDYRAARIPYSRNHDSAMCGIYGGPYSHDITCIFPRFDADPEDPASYDFACTDEAILTCLEAGTKTFFRLGQTIEHQIKKHGTIPPADFNKWAVICEHIIRHYTEGWADGFHHDMPYWEIWNEADLDGDDSANKRCWGGTKMQFFDFYETAAKHLKACFPQLKIGGPALAWNEEWAEDFLCEMQKRAVAIDFFSWHIYTTEPTELARKAERIKALLVKYGYGAAECILNEWNYIKSWGKTYVESLKVIHGMKGAAFTMACMCAANAAPIDMLMYYDARPSVFNGLFDFYTYEKLMGYTPFLWYGDFYDLSGELSAIDEIPGIYSICGANENGRITCIVAYYSDDDAAQEKRIALDFGRNGRFEIYTLDAEHSGEKTAETDAPVITVRPNCCIKIKEI